MNARSDSPKRTPGNDGASLMLRILLLGADWHGSDALGLARAFRRLGHAVRHVAPDRFVPNLGVGWDHASCGE